MVGIKRDSSCFPFRSLNRDWALIFIPFFGEILIIFGDLFYTVSTYRPQKLSRLLFFTVKTWNLSLLVAIYSFIVRLILAFAVAISRSADE